MSIAAIRSALETRLNTLSPAIATAYENSAFVPPAPTVPYQACFVLFATPDNREAGSAYQELGVFQVNLFYPLQAGPGAAAARATMIRLAFEKGTSLTASGVVVIVNRTPVVGNGVPEGDHWKLPVRVPFVANIT